MKKLFFMLGLCLLAAGAGSCTDDTEKDNARIAELEEQIAALKAQLENNAKITNVAFADGQMTLTFGDGTVLTTATPDNIVPTIGENGNWWVNGEDLGVSAEAQIPTVGSNGNWWVGGEDTGVSAKGDKGDQGDKGDKGDKGDTGTGIQSTSYDPETGILTITLTDGTKYEYALSTDGEELIGNRLEDLNGAYLLASILNGDLPFAQLTYDDQNRMTSIAYYETLLNAPVKSADVKFTYNADGKIATRTATYYAKQNQVTDIESTAIYNPRRATASRDGSTTRLKPCPRRRSSTSSSPTTIFTTKSEAATSSPTTNTRPATGKNSSSRRWSETPTAGMVRTGQHPLQGVRQRKRPLLLPVRFARTSGTDGPLPRREIGIGLQGAHLCRPRLVRQGRYRLRG